MAALVLRDFWPIWRLILECWVPCIPLILGNIWNGEDCSKPNCGRAYFDNLLDGTFITICLWGIQNVETIYMENVTVCMWLCDLLKATKTSLQNIFDKCFSQNCAWVSGLKYFIIILKCNSIEKLRYLGNYYLQINSFQSIGPLGQCFL